MFYLHFINTVVRRNRMRQVGLKTQKVSVHRNNIQVEYITKTVTTKIICLEREEESLHSQQFEGQIDF